MIKQFAYYVYHGWCNDDASWFNVFVSLVVIGCAWFAVSFIMYGVLLLIY